jgi:hypothetical protein
MLSAIMPAPIPNPNKNEIHINGKTTSLIGCCILYLYFQSRFCFDCGCFTGTAFAISFLGATRTPGLVNFNELFLEKFLCFLFG